MTAGGGSSGGVNVISATKFVFALAGAIAKGFPAGEAGAGVYGRPRLMRGRGAGLNVVSATEFVFALAGSLITPAKPGSFPHGEANGGVPHRNQISEFLIEKTNNPREQPVMARLFISRF